MVLILTVNSMADAIERMCAESTNHVSVIPWSEPIEDQQEEPMLKAGLQLAMVAAAATSRHFFPDFDQVDAKARANPGRLKDGQSTKAYPSNGARAMERRRRQMEKAAAK